MRTGRELRLWSAGCATGEEAYSLAILVADALGDELDQFNVRIFATDLDPDAIGFARRGIYAPAALAAMPPALVERHFTRTDDGYELNKAIRKLCVFGQHDLGQRAPFPRIDLALCRNVLIYFTPELQKRALQLFAFSLRDEGFLVLGKSETTSPLAEHFVLDHPRFKIYRRQRSRAPLPTAPLRHFAPTRADYSPVGVAESRMLARRELAPRVERRQAAAVRPDAALLHLPVGVVIVNRAYDVQLINNAARVLLGIHGAAVGEDLVHAVSRLPSAGLRELIEQAFAGEGGSSTFDVAGDEIEQGEIRCLRVVAQPHQPDADTASDLEAVVLTIVDDSTAVLSRRESERRFEQERGEVERLRGLMEELATRNRRLVAANEQLASVNADLRSLNDELLVSSEEAQAATEEVETLNEEMQATNEELETLDEELQATVEELNTTNHDLQARSIELQELAAANEEEGARTEAERARLDAVLGSMAEAVLVFDQAGRLVLSNAACRRMFGEAGERFVPEDSEGRPLPEAEHPRARAARGETFQIELMLSSEGKQRAYEAAGAPIVRQGDARAEGGVVVIRDITERQLAGLQDQFVALTSHELRNPLAAAKAHADLLARGLDRNAEPGTVRRHLASLQAQLARLAEMIGELFEATRVDHGKLTIRPAETNLAEFVAHVAESAEPLLGGIPLRVTLEVDSVRALVDASRLEQALFNLLRNAATHGLSERGVDLQLRSEPGFASILVSDYGPGIAESDLRHLFTRYFQTERSGEDARPGLGLGLFLARAVIEAHGGTMEADSRRGLGTTFRIRLPALPGPT